MEPTILVSGASALLTAIQTWIKYQDSRRAAAEFDRRFKEAENDPRVRIEAVHIGNLVPQDVLDGLTERARRCWERYRDFMKDGPLPVEASEATKAVQKCLCRELRHIVELNKGHIPDGNLREVWEAYSCSTVT